MKFVYQDVPNIVHTSDLKDYAGYHVKPFVIRGVPFTIKYIEVRPLEVKVYNHRKFGPYNLIRELSPKGFSGLWKDQYVEVLK